MLAGPIMAVGVGLTVMVVVTEQKPAMVYVMAEVPRLPPVTTPVSEPMVAIPVLPLIQVPPLTASLSVIVEPTHTAVGPVMAVGILYTVTTAVAIQPYASA